MDGSSPTSGTMRPRTSRQSADRQAGAERHVDCRRDRPCEDEIPGAHPGSANEPGGTDDSGGAQMVRVCSGNTLPRGVKGKWYLLQTARGNQAHEIYDVTDPAKPTRLTTVVDGLDGTHKSWWECDTGIAFLVGDLKSDGWTGGRHPNIYDLSDPTKPFTFVTSDWSARSQMPRRSKGWQTGIGSHGLISAGPERNRVYVSYGSGRNGVLQILDGKSCSPSSRTRRNPTREEMLAPQVGYVVMSPDNGAHTTMPVFGVPIPTYQRHTVLKTRDFVIVTSEQGRGHASASPGPTATAPRPHLAFLVDVTNEATPWNLSTFHVDERHWRFLRQGRTVRSARRD